MTSNLSAPPSDLLRSLVPPPAPPEAQALQFPWPEVRDFISTMVSGMLAQQNLMIGEAMLAGGDPNARPEQVQNLQAMVKKLDEQLGNLNQMVESKLHQMEGRRPKLILPKY